MGKTILAILLVTVTCVNIPVKGMSNNYFKKCYDSDLRIVCYVAGGLGGGIECVKLARPKGILPGGIQ